MDQGEQAHFPEHIKGIVAGCPVRANTDIKPFGGHLANRREAISQLGVAGRVSHDICLVAQQDVHVIPTHFYAVRQNRILV